ncbi:hypothetical protein J2795_002473 [Chryseobacterium bernardetii]|jgi:hypothetical protein|uniref:Uncharacterized protein n=2 Tax=Chryseobacterium TaxID=59732 RepID=A0A543EGK7_9FLAO|nr:MULTISPECIES: hypothetical protein [Chryseobacterium]MDR6370761.1 hypothetical protein [Chryseobacterium vietnamense]MDR6441767.1 hypothetical protein [Chryseobacterium bernardetii]TQM20718.1 hypothetical protein FB551_0392 [Chryseobacterium aquifrigidense]
MEIIMEIVCQVYAGQKSRKTIDLVLNTFLPGYEKLNLNYTYPRHDKNYIFKTEDEMIGYFIENPGLDQTFYWNKYHDNPDKIMVGANITDDDKLVISLTMDTTEDKKNMYFDQLKKVLQSDIGVITYVNPADYEDGEDFIVKYG